MFKKFVKWLKSFFVKTETVKHTRTYSPIGSEERRVERVSKYLSSRGYRNANCHYATTKGFTVK